MKLTQQEWDGAAGGYRDVFAEATENLRAQLITPPPLAPIMRATRWKTNADMILAVKQLGYLRDKDRVLDPTYGRGSWWKKWKPPLLYFVNRKEAPWWDFTDMRLWFNHDNKFLDETFDVVAFDPPYKLNGRPDPDVDERYGVDQRATWQERHELIKKGILECFRVLRPSGILLLKCQDQVCSGKIRWQTLEFSLYALMRGHELIDRFDMLGGRAQPAGRRQVHTHSSYSTLLVFKKKA